MPKNKFLIAPFTSGLVKDMPVWQTPEDSFYKLKNAQVHRGVIKKRFGSKYVGTGEETELLAQLKSRLRITVGTTDGNGDISSAADALPAGAIFGAGQMFSIGDEIFTVPGLGTPVTMLTTGTAGARTLEYNTTTGAYTITGADATTDLYWYPSQPVMGLTMYEAGPINDHSAIAFDTRFAYEYSGSGWDRIGTQVYKGDDLNYFWATNFEGTTQTETALFATNYLADGANSDPIYYTLDKTTWTAFKPKIRVAGTADQNIVITAKIIAPFKSRLCLFGTYEYENKTGAYSYKSFKNRVRYSAVGNPLTVATGWLEAKQTGYIGGGYIDAPTEEEIMSVQYVGDRMIVFFERSTYELAYTFNDILPFVWQKISSDLGSESLFSSIPSSNLALTIGATGIHACNGVSVKRIDTKIPDEIFKFLKVADATKRIHGIKDYFNELFYWSIPGQSEDDDDNYPDAILSYNYENNSWAIFDDSITCFGYFEQILSETWKEDYQTWEDDDTSWDSGESVAGNRKIIYGNQHGFVAAVSSKTNSNAAVLQVSKIDGTTVTIYNHNLVEGSKILLHNTGVTAQDKIYNIDEVVTDNTITINNLDVPSYKGGATASRVSRISIKSTAWNPYIKQGQNVTLHSITFGVKSTTSGQINVNPVPSGSSIDLRTESIAAGANMGSYVLEMSPYELVPLEVTQSLLWHTVYIQTGGNSVQVHLTWDEEQMLNKNIMKSNFEIQGMILTTSPSGFIG